MTQQVCAEPGCPETFTAGIEGLRGYCERHKLCAVLDGFDQITQHFGDVVERLDSVEEKLSAIRAERRS